MECSEIQVKFINEEKIMAIGWQQILIVAVIALVFFGGKGKISSLMGDLGRGIRAFRQGLAPEDKRDAAIKKE